ncbi:MAG: hypothetical protein M3O50_20445 [Myxococcota bacterium]|nr:hypothetical protein [Myxococcota bacterium]
MGGSLASRSRPERALQSAVEFLEAAVIERSPRMDPMSFGIYLGGIVLVVGGLVYAALLLHVPTPWIVAGGLVVMGCGVLTAVKATRRPDG